MRFVNHHQGCCGYLPTRADGTEWGHVLTLGSGVVVHADTAAECLDELLPGYEALPDDAARLAARTAHAEAAATRAQQALVDDARRHGRLPSDPRQDDADDRAVVALLTAGKDAPMLLASPDRPGEQAPWQGPAPLVAVTTTYAPTSSTPPLRGDVRWLDPASEEGYLRSLDACGLHDYWSRDDG